VSGSVPFRLYVISDRRRMGDDPIAAVARLARAGLRAFQWREKDLSPAENLKWIRAIAADLATAAVLEREDRSARASKGGTSPPVSTAAPPMSLFVNDRIDLALAARCHVHLTESSIPTDCARALVPAGTLIGRSTHSLAGAREAQRTGADFVTFGPVYETPSKLGYGPPAGTEALRAVCESVAIPVFALGGVTAERVVECLEAGAHGVAVIGAVWDAAEPVEAVRGILRSLPG
jgi:thiamine-phosphate pyrophosphorylase